MSAEALGTPTELAVIHLLDAMALVIAMEGQHDPAEGSRLWGVVRRAIVAEGNAQVTAYHDRLVRQQQGD